MRPLARRPGVLFFMVKIMKKTLISLIIACFLTQSAGVSCLPCVVIAKPDALRPMAHRITSNKNGNIYPELNKLVEMLTSLNPQNKKQLAFEISILADFFRGIRECFAKDWLGPAGEIATEAIKNNIPGITSEDIRTWIGKCFARDWIDSAGEIAIEAIKNKTPGVTSEDIRTWTGECFAKDWPGLAAKITIEAIKNNIPGITPEDAKKGIREYFVNYWRDLATQKAIKAIRDNTPGATPEDIKTWVRECFAKDRSDLALEITIEVVKNKTPGVTPEDIKTWVRQCLVHTRPALVAKIAIKAMKNNIPGITSEDVKKMIRELFANKYQELAVKVAIEAIRETRLHKKIARVFSILKASGLYSKDTQILDLQVISYALQNDLLDDLVAILTALKADKQILHLIDMLILKEGEEPVLNEIFIQKGLRSFVELHKSIYPHIFADLLSEDVDISNQRVNATLNSITYFEASTFPREDLTITKIYEQYYDDYKAGRIKPLPEGLPPIRTIEVSTRKLQSLTDNARQYYTKMMHLVKSARAAINRSANSSATVYQDISVKLLEAVEKRISSLNQVKVKKDLLGAAIDHTDKQIHVLKEAAVIISGSIKEGTPCLISFRQEHIRAISRIKGASRILQSFLFILAFQENPTWKNHFKRPENQYPSEINITQFVDFVDSFIKPHLLDTMQQKARVLLLKHANSKIFKEEINRLSQAKGTFKRRVHIYPTRGWIAEFIGYYSNECWTQTRNIMRDNPDTIALVFVDDETGNLLGGTLLMPNSVDEKGVLIDRGLSPRTTVTAQLNTEDFVTKIADYEEEIARSLGKEIILVPLRGLEAGLGTNNPDIIEYYKRTLSSRQPVVLDRDNNFNDHGITTGKCVILREFSLIESSSVNYVLVPKPLSVKNAFMAPEKSILSAA